MTVFPTCKNCVLEKQSCVRRDVVRSAIAGLGITSAKLRCKGRQAIFTPGQRVTVAWPVPDYDDKYGNHSTLESWPATVISEIKGRFLIKVDDVDSDHETPARSYVQNPTLFAKVPAARLAALNEPAQPVCATCGRPGTGAYGLDGCYGQPQMPGHSEYRPHGCLALA